VTIAVSTLERVRTVIEPLVSERGLALYDLELSGGVVRVLVESSDLEVIAKLTREISKALDEADPIDGRYTLEVSSPGLERVLRTPAHFAGAIGTKVRIKVRPDVEGDRRVEGILTAADDETFTVGPIATGDATTLRYDQIEKARTVFEWEPTPKPGKAKVLK
jgi:ribosome maturation factor RimP